VRSEVWWATEPGVPDDLRPVAQPRRALGFQKLIPVDVAERRRRWLRETGEATAEEIRKAKRYAHLRGSS
jgi:hypothetical protein